MSSTPPLAIATHGLSKRYGSVTALTDLELRVRAGEVYALLGLNGAGKTTTIRLLLGMIRATKGQAELFGVPLVRGQAPPWHRVGYLVGSATAYADLTVRENLESARLLQRLPERAATERALERLGLSAYAHRRAGTLSTGNLQRLALARALLHEPELLLLDEPTVGLDPAGVVEVRELLRSLVRDGGATVFLSSHVLSEVERVASRIAILHEGRLVEELSVAELDARRGRRLEVGAVDMARAEAVLRAAGFEPAHAGDGSSASVLELREARALERPGDVATLLVEAGIPPVRLAVVQDDMESYFLSLTRRPGGRA